MRDHISRFVFAALAPAPLMLASLAKGHYLHCSLTKERRAVCTFKKLL